MRFIFQGVGIVGLGMETESFLFLLVTLEQQWGLGKGARVCSYTSVGRVHVNCGPHAGEEHGKGRPRWKSWVKVEDGMTASVVRKDEEGCGHQKE